MTYEVAVEFAEFISEISSGICCRLKKYYPDGVCERMEREFTHGNLDAVLDGVIRDWGVHVYHGEDFADYDEMISILMINMIGAVNRLSAGDVADVPRFSYIYLAMLAKSLSCNMVRQRFLSISRDLMLQRAA